MLLENGAEPDVKNNTGVAPLHVGAAEGRTEVSFFSFLQILRALTCLPVCETTTSKRRRCTNSQSRERITSSLGL